MKRVETGGLPLVQFDLLSQAKGLAHGVTTRHGGVSPAPFDTLNLSIATGDLHERVIANRTRVAQAFYADPTHLMGCHQVHGARVVLVDDQPGESLRAERADVLITRRAGRFISLRFADCVPVLVFDPRQRAVAIAHAGWRGTAADAPGAAVRGLVEAFGSRPGDLLAGIGPSIGPCCYEVGADTAAHFSDRPRGVLRDNDRLALDLWTLNHDLLAAAGVPEPQIETSDVCTRCHADEFFSHRAAGGGPSGRFAAVAGVL